MRAFTWILVALNLAAAWYAPQRWTVILSAFTAGVLCTVAMAWSIAVQARRDKQKAEPQ